MTPSSRPVHYHPEDASGGQTPCDTQHDPSYTRAAHLDQNLDLPVKPAPRYVCGAAWSGPGYERSCGFATNDEHAARQHWAQHGHWVDGLPEYADDEWQPSTCCYTPDGTDDGPECGKPAIYADSSPDRDYVDYYCAEHRP